MVPDARRGLRRDKVTAGGLEKYQHRIVFKRRRIGEVDHHLRAGHRLFEPLAGDRVDSVFGRGGDDLVAALAQNSAGLRADQASAADHDDLHGDLLFRGLETLDNRRSSNRFECPRERATTKLSHGFRRCRRLVSHADRLGGWTRMGHSRRSGPGLLDAIPGTLLWRKHRIADACLGAAVGFVAWLTGWLVKDVI